MKNVVLVQRSIPHYRFEFLNKLKNKLLDNNLNLIIIHSDKNLSDFEGFFYLKPTLDISLNFLYGERFIFSYQLIKVLRKLSPQLILTEDISNLPNGLLISVYSKLNKCNYGIIGLGEILSKKRSILKKILYVPVSYFRNNANFFIAYSSVGAEYYRLNYKKDVITWNNSVCNISEISVNDLRNKYSQKNFNILFIGRIEKFKKLDLLIDALESIEDKDIILNIIGDGSEMRYLKEKYKNSNTKINWLGKILDKKTKEKYFKNSHLGVMPGNGGLVIQELQSYAIPVIASYSDGTEIDLIKNINPRLFNDNLNCKTLKMMITNFKELSLDDKIDVTLSAYDITKTTYNLDNMINIVKNKILKELI